MIERERNPKELRETFKVLGSTGNVYTVRIDTLPSCDCMFTTEIGCPVSLIPRSGPDALKGNHCKHIVRAFFLPVKSTETSFAVIRLSEGRQQTCRSSRLNAVVRSLASVGHPPTTSRSQFSSPYLVAG